MYEGLIYGHIKYYMSMKMAFGGHIKDVMSMKVAFCGHEGVKVKKHITLWQRN